MSTEPEPTPPPSHDPHRRRTPEEDAEWEAEKRLEYEADRCCGHDWSNI